MLRTARIISLRRCFNLSASGLIKLSNPDVKLSRVCIEDTEHKIIQLPWLIPVDPSRRYEQISSMASLAAKKSVSGFRSEIAGIVRFQFGDQVFRQR